MVVTHHVWLLVLEMCLVQHEELNFLACSVFVFVLFIYLFIYLFLAALDLCCCVRAFSSCGKQRLLFVAVCGFLVAVACIVVEHRL